MNVDDCPHTFDDLATRVLPKYMDQLRRAFTSPWPASEFAAPNVGPRSLARRFGLGSDFSGCYSLLEGGKPIYVGISRGVLGRVRQHVFGRSHFDASLAYRMAQHGLPTKGRRSANMMNADFRRVFNEAQQYLRSLSVAVLQIDNPLELYLFEAYAAMEVKTSRWNSFRTH